MAASASTARRGLPIPPLRPLLRRGWREYTRMRTAIVFLIALVLIVLVGSFVPQQDTSQQVKVDEFISSHGNLDRLATHLGLPLTEVFVSPLLIGLFISLYIALGACVLRRGRALVVRTLRHYPRTPQYWGEWGSWLFHTSLFLLLVAVVVGKATGFEGLMVVTEGRPVTDTPADYATLREGFLAGSGAHGGFQLTLNRFSATYQANGQPDDYVSNVTVRRNGAVVTNKDIRVNDFLDVDGVDVYQQDFGFAPVLRVTNPDGRVVFDGPVQFFGDNKAATTGVLKVPGFSWTVPGASSPVQVGAKMVVFPDARTIQNVGRDGSVAIGSTNFGPGGPTARNPVLQVQLFVGDLGLGSGAPQNVNDLDTSHMRPYFADATALPLPLNQTLQLPLAGTDCRDPHASGCFQLQFTGLRSYSLFRVKRDSGVPIVYAAFALVMVGLMTKLYARPLMERRMRRRGGSGSADLRSVDITDGAVRLEPVGSGYAGGAGVEPEREPSAIGHGGGGSTPGSSAPSSGGR